MKYKVLSVLENGVVTYSQSEFDRIEDAEAHKRTLDILFPKEYHEVIDGVSSDDVLRQPSKE